MAHSASVSITGPAFSFLVYETSKANARQNGFLLGEIVHKETSTITDNEQNQVNISEVIKINSIIPWTSTNYFSRAVVDKEKLHTFLGDNFSKVVGWYKYEPSSTVRLSLKDRLLHKQFRQLFNVPEELFMVCVCLSEYRENFATHNYQQCFMRFSNNDYEKINLTISNLSDSTTDYRDSEPASELVSSILSKINIDIENSKEVVAVIEIENVLQNYIDETSKELSEAEKKLFELEQETKLLQENNVLSVQQDSDIVESENDSEHLHVLETSDEKLKDETALLRRSTRTKCKTNGETDSNKKNSKQNNIGGSSEVRGKPKKLFKK